METYRSSHMFFLPPQWAGSSLLKASLITCHRILPWAFSKGGQLPPSVHDISLSPPPSVSKLCKSHQKAFHLGYPSFAPVSPFAMCVGQFSSHSEVTCIHFARKPSCNIHLHFQAPHTQSSAKEWTQNHVPCPSLIPGNK